MEQNKEQLKCKISKSKDCRNLSYAEVKERILAHSKDDLSKEVITKRMNSVKQEMRQIKQNSTLTPKEYLTPFII